MIYLIMGVLGSGKTTIGKKLAQKMDCSFHDGDYYHPQANRDKMAAGIPLTDNERRPWLEAIRAIIDNELNGKKDSVVACSALKESYRSMLMQGTQGIMLVYLKGTEELIAGRLKGRKGHFVAPSLLHSQFETLEEPKNALVVDIGLTPDEIVEKILVK